jgi:hypothetical protein
VESDPLGQRAGGQASFQLPSEVPRLGVPESVDQSYSAGHHGMDPVGMVSRGTAGELADLHNNPEASPSVALGSGG